MAKKKDNINPDITGGNDKAINLTISALEKDLGKGIVIWQENSIPGVEYFSSGVLSLDIALGGGYPYGRIIEIFGPESSGKTTLTLHAIAEIQKLGKRAAFVDVEHALDPAYASALNIDMNQLLISQPRSGEDALNVVSKLCKSNAVSLIVVDSVANLVPKAELEGDIGDSHMGRQARLMSQAMRLLAGDTYRANCTVMFTNQIRMKIGVMFGNPETTSGGNALKFYASQRLDIRRTGNIKEGETTVASSTRVRVIKNKVATPFKESEFNIQFGRGVDISSDILNLAIPLDIVEKSGAWYSYNSEQIGQGEANTCRYLREHPETLAEIRSKVVSKLHE